MIHTELAKAGAGGAEYQCDVSVLGLGAMGARIAEVLLSQGRRVAVWNRSRHKSDELEMAGAHPCGSAEAAISASPVSILVLLDHVAAQDLLWSIGNSDALAGRNIINFTTTSMEESRTLQQAFETMGANYVKGAIVAYPRNIGHPESYAIYSGNAEAITASRRVLDLIAPNAVVLPLEEAYAFSVMLHVHAFASTMSFYEAVAASSRFGTSLTKIARQLSDASRFFVADAIHDAALRIEANDFADDQARLDVHASAFEYLADAMHEKAASSLLFDQVRRAARDACNAGYGGEDIVAMVKVFAQHPASSSPPSARRASQGLPL